MSEKRTNIVRGSFGGSKYGIISNRRQRDIDNYEQHIGPENEFWEYVDNQGNVYIEDRNLFSVREHWWIRKNNQLWGRLKHLQRDDIPPNKRRKRMKRAIDKYTAQTEEFLQCL